jgi:hypothetical protein
MPRDSPNQPPSESSLEMFQYFFLVEKIANHVVTTSIIRLFIRLLLCTAWMVHYFEHKMSSDIEFSSL